MNVPILVCGCGMRIKAPGAKPGRVGRCPSCGGRLEVPSPAAETDWPVEPDEPPPPIRLADRADDPGRGPGNRMTPAREKRRRKRPRDDRSVAGSRPPMADGILPVLPRPETSWLVSFAYPLRGADSMAMAGTFGVLLWVFGVLLGEYAIQAMADTGGMGASLMGMLLVLITGLPAMFLSPFLISYWLQYLGRVLVTSARGDNAPPRMPDRNFDGFLSGISPWFIWAVLGLGVGLAPAYWLATSGGLTVGDRWMVVALAGAMLPYMLAALMLSFLHDDTFAAMPWGVLWGLIRLGPAFALLSGLIAAALAVVGGCFALALFVRERAYWPYLLLALPWCILFTYVQMVIMRLLGLFYHHRTDRLRWHRVHPRWGEVWKV